MRYLFPVLLFMTFMAPHCFGQTPKPAYVMPAVEQELRALMQTEYSAGQHNDGATINRIWADEYISTGPKGQTATKADLLKYYKTAPVSQTKIGPLVLNNVQLQVYGDVAVMTGRVTGTSQSGKPVGASLRFTRVHVKRQGQWVVVANHLSRIEPSARAVPVAEPTRTK